MTTANQAFKKCQTALAMAGYVDALQKMPELGKTILANISRARQQYLNSRKNSEKLNVVVCGWELSHNAAGRAHTLAEIYREMNSDVEIVGSIFPGWGRLVWEPIRQTTIPIHSFIVESERFIVQALEVIAAHPADIVHLSKPRAPNIYFAIFYKLLWGARVIIDIDDEELAFVKAETHLNIFDYLRDYPTLPPLNEITGAHWTRIAVGLVNEFDAITVSNTALQSRYGGVVIGHARDPRTLKPCPELRKKSRLALGIQNHQKVVLFSGTPRPHKGLVEVAKVIQALRRKDIVFVIAGSFGEKYLNFKSKLLSITGVNYLFIENQTLKELPNTLALADCCILFQDINSLASNNQIPAKLSDAFAMDIPVITSATPALKDVIEENAVITASSMSEISSSLVKVLSGKNDDLIARSRDYFDKNLSLEINSLKLNEYLGSIEISNKSILEGPGFHLLKYIHLFNKA